MPLQALRRNSLIWLACALLWLAALLPTLSQSVLAQPLREGWVEVCSGSGMVWVRADWEAPRPNPTHENAAAAPACDWCLKHPTPPALGPTPALVWLNAAGHSAPAAAGAQRIGHTTQWWPALPRAPPLHTLA
ncbi:DUF2946 family protein [Serpentinimonas barnesii]|uniref:DUF2946 family protein n=1 Tax=Serpentinimonas barnesii TaxID=1458427 RepID=UPI0004964359|nr:DUF2946 family protein [Serpentinimonas barnesii]